MSGTAQDVYKMEKTTAAEHYWAILHMVKDQEKEWEKARSRNREVLYFRSNKVAWWDYGEGAVLLQHQGREGQNRGEYPLCGGEVKNNQSHVYILGKAGGVLHLQALSGPSSFIKTFLKFMVLLLFL